ncbi:MAG: hypothetical protein IJ072_06720 [Oscillospiraceae bacterium]|nr:hypothetical protein [Oscillospiraceae bacterium]
MNETEKKRRFSQESEYEIDIMPLLRALFKKIWVLVIAAIVCGALAFVGSHLLITPMYQSRFTAYVNNRRTVDDASSLSNSDLNASQSLSNTYIQIIRSRVILEAAAEKVGTTYTYSQLLNIVSASVASNTQIITVRVTTPSIRESYDLANAISELIPEKGAEIIEGSSIKIIDSATLPAGRYSPNYTRNTMLGMLIGILIAAVIVVLMEIIDNHIKSQSEFENYYDIPIIGVIPNISAATKTKKKIGYGETASAESELFRDNGKGKSKDRERA